MTIVAAWPRMMRPDVAQEYVGGRAVLEAMLKQKLVKPRVQNARFTVYDKSDLDAACDAFRSLDGEE